MRERILRPEHPDTRVARNNLPYWTEKAASGANWLRSVLLAVDWDGDDAQVEAEKTGGGLGLMAVEDFGADNG